MRAAIKSAARTKPPEARRGELMNAAKRLFLEHGVEATTVEQITAAAGVAKGTFYLYFSSKEELRAALGERFAQDHLARLEKAIAEHPEAGWTARLAVWARTSIAFYLDRLKLHDMLFYEARSPTREGLVDNIVIDHLATLLQAGSAAGAWSVDDPRFTAVFLFSGLHAVVDDAVTKEKRANRHRLVRRAERLCLRAVGQASG
jgi:AcrR family transcriptional regulator